MSPFMSGGLTGDFLLSCVTLLAWTLLLCECRNHRRSNKIKIIKFFWGQYGDINTYQHTFLFVIFLVLNILSTKKIGPKMLDN